MKKTMMLMMLLAGGLFASPRVTVGIGIGVPAPVAVVRPACPGPGYVWMNGYWAPPVAVRVGPVVHERVFDHRYDDHRFADHRFEHFRR